MPPARVLLLRERVTRDDLDRARAEHGWLLANVVPAAPDRPSQLTLLTADEHEALVFVDDAHAGEQYVAIHLGAGRGEEEVRSSLPVWADEELARLVAAPATDGERALGLRGLALGAGPALTREELAATFDAGLRAPAVEVRAAALYGVAVLGLAELSERLHRMVREDRDGELRGRARQLLDAGLRGRP
jgi:hypothetical protein